MEIKNAVIKSAELNISEGFLMANITFDYGGICQGFGGYVMYLPKSCTNHKLEGVAGHFIYRIMEVAGVERWSDLVGKTVRVMAEYVGVNSVGHIIKDDWFTPSKDFKDIE